jgi:murein DD-endopeptidase MepM/ murein hydrolase activator NlpD
MLPRDTVPATRFVKLHNKGPAGLMRAADVFGRRGNIILAPANGRVVFNGCPDDALHPGCQIRGFVILPDGREMGFVLAHLMPGMFVRPGQTFRKGQTIGRMAFWEQRPFSTHVHWAFNRPGTGMPPPANMSVLAAFNALGPPPPRTLRLPAVPYFAAEESAQLAEEDRLVVQESEHGEIPALEEE